MFKVFARLAKTSHKPIFYMGLWLLFVSGCGTTRQTETPRTATEMLLLSNAVDQTVSEFDLSYLSGKEVFLDTTYLDTAVDKGYVISSIRQHMMASGVKVVDTKEKASYVVEARTGALGTDSHSVMVGVPQMTIPQVVPVPGVPSSVPEIPLAKRTKQTGVAKLALFAYHRDSGQIVWQSGVQQFSSHAKDSFVFGMGPFRSGTIQRGTTISGSTIPLTDLSWSEDAQDTKVKPTEPFAWADPAKKNKNGAGTSPIQPVSAEHKGAPKDLPASVTNPAAPAPAPAPAGNPPAPAPTPAGGAPATPSGPPPTASAPQVLPSVGISAPKQGFGFHLP